STSDIFTPPSRVDCAPLAPASGKVVTVKPDQAAELRTIVASATSGTTILLEDGTYLLDAGDSSSRLQFSVSGVTLRSKSGDPSNVILDGGYKTNELVSILASDVTIAEITLMRAYDHPIHVSGSATTISGTRIYRVRIIDPGQQAIKINTGNNETTFADNGTIACSEITLTEAGRAKIRDNCYTGGIDGHQAWGWRVRDNLIRGFYCSSGLSEHGVHFWNGSRDTIVERNRIIDCARGIGFGLGANGNGSYRTYPDGLYAGLGYIGHYGGIIRNNAIVATIAGFDSGISLEQSRGTYVLHNSVVSQQPPFSSIEWRFANTEVTLTNNLVSHNLRERDGNPSSTSAGNLENAPVSLFVDPWNGDLHLQSTANAVLGKGVDVPLGLCDDDIDGEARTKPRDIGADQRHR
ncbi:MAG: hypothetical protein KC609_10110, partial [Myxococcales bacterium]|nr:hypothetical protein [Myxococcales bacterium]